MKNHDLSPDNPDMDSTKNSHSQEGPVGKTENIDFSIQKFRELTGDLQKKKNSLKSPENFYVIFVNL